MTTLKAKQFSCFACFTSLMQRKRAQTMRALLLCVAIFGICGMTACTNLLEQKPETEISDAGAITNVKGAEAAIAGMYNALQGSTGQGNNTGRGYTGRFQMIADVSSDIAQSIGTWDFYREMDTYSVNVDNQEIREYWFGAYRAVNQANNIIAAVPGLGDAPQEVKNRMLGEAYFVRALVFFDLARTFGGIPGVYGELGVPLPLEPSRGVSQPTRASLQDTWTRIEADLNQARTLLQGVRVDRTRANIGAVNALLARMYLYIRNYARAAELASTVLADSTYFRLTPTVAEIYANKNTTESIFELQFNAANQSDARLWYAPGAIGGRGDLAAHTEFYMSIPDADARKALFGFDMVTRVWYPTKYIKGGNIDNQHIIRVAEMLLTRAEAIVRGNLPAGQAQALADLNRVRTRARLPAYDATRDGSLETAIERERAVELMFEGHRWFDLVRTGRALTVLASVPRSNAPGSPARLTAAGRQVMPIPNVDIINNPNLVQNSAYR